MISHFNENGGGGRGGGGEQNAEARRGLVALLSDKSVEVL